MGEPRGEAFRGDMHPLTRCTAGEARGELFRGDPHPCTRCTTRMRPRCVATGGGGFPSVVAAAAAAAEWGPTDMAIA